MSSLRLALSLVKIPQLFLSLLFWPLLAGLALASGQVIITMAYLRASNQTAGDIQQRLDDQSEPSLLRQTLYGLSSELPDLKVCEWRKQSSVHSSSTTTSIFEAPTEPGCQLEPYDVVIRTTGNSPIDVDSYRAIFNGAALKIHLCSSCSSEIIITPAGGNTISDYTVYSFGVYLLKSMLNHDVANHFVEAFDEKARQEELEGRVLVRAAGLHQPIDFKRAQDNMVIIVNISLLIVIALWLSLKSYRRVLQYFARSDALLPLVAACGKETFYGAIWIITCMRVSLFLLASIPFTYVMHRSFVKQEILEHFAQSTPEFILWVMGIVVSLGSMAVIASIGELKQRHTFFGFLYNYLPLVSCVVGTLLWGATLLSDSTAILWLQRILASLPILGSASVILSPIVHLDENVMAIHTLLCTALIAALLRFNSKWFAAHLEEI